jgi:hypothetical protein
MDAMFASTIEYWTDCNDHSPLRVVQKALGYLCRAVALFNLFIAGLTFVEFHIAFSFSNARREPTAGTKP